MEDIYVRNACLKAAVNADGGDGDVTYILETAAKFFKWIKKGIIEED